MTTRKRGAAPEADDLADVPFLDDAERDESAWLLARERDPGAPAPALNIASEYGEIEDLLSNLPAGSLDERWQDEVLRAASPSAPPSRPWWRRAAFRWAMGGTFVTAAAIAVLVLISRAPTPELDVAILDADPARGRSREVVVGDQTRSASEKAAVGSRLVVTARPRGAGDLRVFRREATDGTLVAGCPHGPKCVAPAQGEYTIEITLDAPGEYQVILVVGMSNALPSGTMNAYLKAASDASVRIVMSRPIEVR